MNRNKIIAGIELGSSKTATVVAQISTDEGSFEEVVNIIGVSVSISKGVKKGQIVNIDESVESAITSIEAAERMAGHKIDSAFVALGGAHITSQNSHGVVAVSGTTGEIIPSDVDRVIEAASAISLPASREIVHVLPREFIVDGEAGVKDPISMSGVRLEVETHVVTASSAAIKNLSKTLSEADIKINDMVFTGLAASYAVLTETEKELGCVLIDIGAGTTSIVAYIDGSLIYSGVIPVGAKNVTNDIAIGLRVSLDTAEKIKLSLSDTKAVKDQKDELDLSSLGISEVSKVSKKTLVEGIIRPRLNEIFTMVKLELEREKIINRIPSGAIVTGGGSKTIGVNDSAKRVLSVPVRIGMPKGVSGLIDDCIDPTFSVPIGLLIFGASKNAPDHGGTFKFPMKLNLPGKGFLYKIIESVKDLLP